MTTNRDDAYKMHSVIPGAHTNRAFRDCLGRFGTGVTVVTATTEKGPIGITANSFSGISLDPPLVLWAPAKSSQRFEYFARARHFAIHVLAAEQKALCRKFARAGDAFERLDWSTNAENVPLITDCLARFECETTATHDGGDHLIIVARVLRAAYRDGDPLLFYAGQYGGFDQLD